MKKREIGKKIKATRIANRLARYELAEKTGIPVSRIGEIEDEGTSGIDPDFQKILECLGLSGSLVVFKLVSQKKEKRNTELERSVAEEIRNRRKVLNLTNRQLALLASVSEGTVRRYEYGGFTMVPDTLESVLRVLGLKLEVIISERGVI